MKKLYASAALLLAAIIWGFAFVAQTVGMDHVGPFTFQSSRYLLGALTLVPVILVSDSREKKAGTYREMTQAEKDLDGTRIKVPDEVSDEVCDVCGRQMVVKSGRFGRFLACPGFPECTFTKPLVIEMPGKCPKCGSRLLKKTSRNGYTYYGCERNGDKLGRACDFMTWDVPVKDNCPECGWTMFKKSGRGFKKPFCINEACPAFVPEEKRGGYRKKKTEEAKTEAAETKEGAAEEKKTTKKTAAKKTTEKKTAAKKTTAKKTAAQKTTKKSEPEEPNA